MQGQTPPAPTRGAIKRTGGQEEGEETKEEGVAGDIMDLLPRTDIRLAHRCTRAVLPTLTSDHQTFFVLALNLHTQFQLAKGLIIRRLIESGVPV